MNIKKVIPGMLSVALASVLILAPSKTDRADAAVINYSLTLSDTNVGTSPRFMGENVTAIGGLTDSEKEWIKNSGANTARIWFNDFDFEPANDNGPYGNGVSNLTSFNAAKNAVISNPANNTYINWNAFNTAFDDNHTGINNVLGFFQANGITPLAVLRTDVESNDPDGIWLPSTLGSWQDYWEWWEYCFAISYHLYHDYGFSEFEIGNEVNLDNRYTPQEYAVLLQYANDAIQSAVHAVNPAVTPGVSLGAFGANVYLSPTVGSYLSDVLNANGIGIDTLAADNYSNYVSYHNYQNPDKFNNGGSNPDPVYTITGIQDAIANNDPDGKYENLMITEGNLKVGDVNPDDYNNNALLAKLVIQLVNRGKSEAAGSSYLRGFWKFRFTSSTVTSTFPDNGSTVTTPASTPEIDHAHQYYFTYNLITKALKARKEVVSATTTLPQDQVIVTKDDDYYYILNTNTSTTDSQKITVNTSGIGITNTPVYIMGSSPVNQGKKWENQITNGVLTLNVNANAVVLVRIPRNYVAKTISSISISPSASITVNPYGARNFTATAHYTDATTADITDRVAWASSNNSNVKMLDTGLAYGLTSGTQAAITCSYQGVTSNAVTFSVN